VVPAVLIDIFALFWFTFFAFIGDKIMNLDKLPDLKRKRKRNIVREEEKD